MSAHDFGASDPIYRRFMQRQVEEGMDLARASDILRLRSLPISPSHFVAEFHCKGLVRDANGEICEAEHFEVGVWFPDDYLRRADPFEMLRIFTPRVFHPNVSEEFPLICVGHITPGTPLADLLYRCYDVLTYQKFNARENDALNKAACQWARENRQRFPIDGRPLKRSELHLETRAL